MSSSQEDERKADARDRMIVHIEGKQVRKMRARRTKDRGTWFGLGMMGTIGWTVVAPTLLGVALGIWIDSRWPSAISWTLVLLIGGLLLGCANAWLWIFREQQAMEREKEDRDVG
jgi:ATP synthase protein I